ncbi:MAG: peptidoglycan-binding protein [Bacteroidetes bacterium HGW-Bacteroidetes-2]|jgi:murein L,D-transpeptidase YcbB/YkuD|nr:MAG: peptidoglycan-binding protein [Bacteroidetes bacterium HGW-Bacteroidetes-2]
MYRKLSGILLILLLIASCKNNPDIEIVPEVTIEETEAGKIIPLDSTSIAILNDSLAIKFYKANDNKTFWISDYSRDKLLTIFKTVEEEGLFKKDFDIEKILIAEDSIKNLSDRDLIAYDYLLTQNLIKYLHKVAHGSLNPKALYTDWDLKENQIDYSALLLNFLKKDGFEKAIKEVQPKHIVYHKLKQALKIIENFPTDTFTPIKIDGKIVLNDTIKSLVDIKQRLIYWKDLKPQDSLTPVYDEQTELAIKVFQMRHGLAPDGVIGFGTVNALNYSKEKRKEQIIANMERWRWYPREFEEEYIILNIPDYTLHTIKKSDTTRTHKVIVGKAARKTPILQSKISRLIFNPTWTVPPTIQKNDIIPAVAKNRSYLAEKRITVYDANGKVVTAEDWDAKKANSYRYVQSSGSSNALGLVKIMFPNRFLVYLHDTNSRSFFERETRSLSSGCVRVQNPFELSEYILDDTINWNLEKINELVQRGKTREVAVKKDIYVHFLYWTAWSDKGSLQFRDDFYNLDASLYASLRN